MSEEVPKSTGSNMLDSRKAKAYLIAEFTWKIIILIGLGLLGYQIWQGQEPSMWITVFLMVVTVIAGFMEAGYIGSQAWLDKYTKGVTGVASAIASAVSPADPKKK